MQDACSISAYAASDNVPTQTIGAGNVRLARSFMPSALPHGHPNPIASGVLPNLSIRLSDNSSREYNSATADNISREYKVKLLNTFLTLKCDVTHY